jgi:hypothetical protein
MTRVALPTAINSHVAIAIFQTKLRTISFGCRCSGAAAFGWFKTEFAMNFSFAFLPIELN